MCFEGSFVRERSVATVVELSEPLRCKEGCFDRVFVVDYLDVRRVYVRPIEGACCILRHMNALVNREILKNNSCRIK